MNKKYTIDGRDPNAKGYVKERRLANEDELAAIKKVLEGLGYRDADKNNYGLYGRLDDVHGWYVFGIKKTGAGMDAAENFLILGDCLDLMERPYDRVLGLDEVMTFARLTGEGENKGTAYDAMQEWGVFTSLSDRFCAVFDAMDVRIENERAHWDAKRKEWELSYDVMFDTDMGGNEQVTITIPAKSSTQEIADREFFSEWQSACSAYEPDERYEDFMIDEREVSEEEAHDLAESKLRGMERIHTAIVNFFVAGLMPGEENEPTKKEESDVVWVLTIYKDKQFFPEVHRTLEGAVESAINDIAEHMDEDEVDDYDYKQIRKELEGQHYWRDDNKDVVYDIAECRVCA